MYYPIISVIITPGNNPEYLRDAIDSVIRQSYPHWEAIVVHSGSDAAINAIMKLYTTRDTRIQSHCIHEYKNNELINPSLLYIAGISKAKGEWISFLSEEDMYTQDRFATLIEHTFTRPDIQMFHTSYILRDETQSTILGVSFPEDLTLSKLFSPLSFMRNSTISLSSIFVHRTLCNPIPTIPKNIKYAYLLSFFMSLSRVAKTGYINTITCHHRLTQQNTFLTTIEKEKRIARKMTMSSNSIAPYDIQFDTGTMCVTLLHTYSLKELFPYLVSDETTLYQSFISAILTTALSPHSLVYACGMHTLLLERFLEWLSNDAPIALKKSLHEYASSSILSQFSSIPLVLQEICSKIVHKTSGEYAFTPEPLRIILARSGAEILRTNPSTAMLYMSYCQKTVPDIYSNMLIYFHDAPVQSTTLHRPVTRPLENASSESFHTPHTLPQ